MADAARAPPPAPCPEDGGWRNWFNHTCRDYVHAGWCRGGAVLNFSSVGSVLGSPECACCACGRCARRSSSATDLLLFATNTLTSADERLLELYKSSAHAERREPFWVLMHRNGRPRLLPSELQRWRSLKAQVWLWSDAMVFDLFPRLPAAIATNPGLRVEQHYVGRYYWSLASLYVWLRTFGRTYPNLRHLWRTELDVVYLGPFGFGGMVERASAIAADVLLPPPMPRHIVEAQYSYVHFRRNRQWLERFPARAHAFALVSIGRYSLAFLRDLMAPQWRQGAICYEEVSLATTCKGSPGCTLKSLDEAFEVRPLQYRPMKSCDQLCSRVAHELRHWCGRPELWHPVKERECLLADECRAHLLARPRPRMCNGTAGPEWVGRYRHTWSH